MRLYSERDFVAAEQRPIELTLVVPTLNERDNVAPLLERIALALNGLEWEVIFVDDASTDGTAELVSEIACGDRRVRLIRRFGRRGLSSAVMEGFLASTAPVVAVIDGDGQHDERALPLLYQAVAEGGCALAVGTRYADGGSVGQWCERRARISGLATGLARAVLKTPLSDPMSGLFAVRRSAVLAAVPRMSSVGFKVLLDLVLSHPEPLQVREIPYRFNTRTAGASKLDSAVALEYFELLLDKWIGRWVPPKLVLFGAIGALGLLVHLALLGLLFHGLGAGFGPAQSTAVLGAMTFNFALNNRFTYRDRRLTGRRWLTGLMSFYLVCSLGALANVGVGSLVYEYHYQWWVAGIAGAVIGSVWNYGASAWLTWTRR